MMRRPKLQSRPLFGAVLAIHLFSLGGPCLCFAQTDDRQEQPGKKGGTPGYTVELTGRVVKVSPATASMVVERNNVDYKIRYTEKTKITYRSEPASAREIKEGENVAISGTFNNLKGIVAVQIDAAQTIQEKK